jgi:hypothetical protein
MPTSQEVSEGLADFRVEVSGRFGKVDAEIASIRTELGFIRTLGNRLLGAAIAGVGTMVAWAALAGWYGSAINSGVQQHGRQIEELRGDIKQQGARLDRVEARLDAMGKQLDTLIGRTAPAPKPGG